MKKWYAVIGNPIEHSLSPFMHETWFNENNMDASYIPIKLTASTLQQGVQSLKLLGCSGFNVTVPFKEAIIPLLDEIDEDARAIGAVNTVVRLEDGSLKGYNTDGLGYLQSFEQHFGNKLRSEKGLIIGAGGAARGIAYALKKAGYDQIYVTNRNEQRASQLVSDLNLKSVFPWQQVAEDLSSFDFLIQTTSVGLNDEEQLTINWQSVKKTCKVSDIIYRPWRTLFLQQAHSHNLTIQNGLPMFVEQGAASFQYWTKVRPNINDISRVLREKVGGKHVNK